MTEETANKPAVVDLSRLKCQLADAIYDGGITQESRWRTTPGMAAGAAINFLAPYLRDTKPVSLNEELVKAVEQCKWLIDDGVRWQGSFSDMATHSKAQYHRRVLADFLLSLPKQESSHE